MTFVSTGLRFLGAVIFFFRGGSKEPSKERSAKIQLCVCVRTMYIPRYPFPTLSVSVVCLAEKKLSFIDL